jgi:hypothetical protein
VDRVGNNVVKKNTEVLEENVLQSSGSNNKLSKNLTRILSG